ALGSRGAWLLEPYTDRPGHVGHETLSMDTVYKTARIAAAQGFQLCTHAIGDLANREVLNQYEKVFHEMDSSGHLRFRIEHAQHLDADDIPRFGKRSEEHTSELQSRENLVCRLLLEKK